MSGQGKQPAELANVGTALAAVFKHYGKESISIPRSVWDSVVGGNFTLDIVGDTKTVDIICKPK